jgi:hypothetical protein
MSLARLCELIPPPSDPSHVPSAEDWERVQAELGTRLPHELFQFATVYGEGTFRGTEATAFGVCSPRYPSFVEMVRFQCERYRECRGDHKDKYHPYDTFPDEGGLFPFGGDETDVWLCWSAKGDPNRWPIVVRWTCGLEGMRTLELSLIDFLVNVLERKLDLPCWPKPFFVDDVRFEPYRGG